MEGDTIVGVALEAPAALHSMLQDGQPPPSTPCDATQRLFKIRSADSPGRRGGANVLINRMYVARGYRSHALAAQPPPAQLTLVASENETTIGTISVGFDGAAGLNAEALFAPQVQRLRASGRRLCEFTQLAMDSVVRSKRVLASLFHVAYIFAHRILGFDDLLIEVNPRHVRYYERMLGFTVIGAPRMNPKVNAPGVLMRLDFGHAHAQIQTLGGHPEAARADRSLYPYFFSVAEEAGIVGRLTRSAGAQPG